MKNIVLFTISLNKMAGGLEKNFILLANHFFKKGYNVHLFTYDLPDAISHYKISQGIKWHKIARTPPHSSVGFKERFLLILRTRKLLKTLKKPIIICFHHGILSRIIFSTIGLRIPIICSERNSLHLYKYIRKTKKWSLSFIFLIITKYITVQFSEYRNDYPWWLKKRIRVVPNPVFPAKKYACPNQISSDGQFVLLQVARLCDQKNQIKLIDAFAKICHKYPNWYIHLVGDGELKNNIIAYIENLNITKRVILLGKKNNISDILVSSHLFCMISKWEGFPNALAEAMAHGLPAIGFKDCPGVNKLIQDDRTGKLTNEAELSQTLEFLMDNPEIRQDMGKKARTYISQYLPKKSFDCWDSLLNELGH